MTPPPTSASHTESPTPATGEPSGTPTPSGSPTPSAQPTSPPTESPPPVPVRAPARHVSDVLPGAPANAVALTFDDGPHPVWSPRILGLLARYGIPATFFMIGKSVQAHPDLARRTLAEAHAVGNHTYDHPLPFTVLSRARMDAEIGDTQQAIAGATGYTPRLFRAPGGEWNAAGLSSAAAHGMIPVGWDVDPKDWSRPDSSVIVQRLSVARAGDILLCHDGGGDRSETLAALDQVLPVLLGRGYRFVALAPTGG